MLTGDKELPCRSAFAPKSDKPSYGGAAVLTIASSGKHRSIFSVFGIRRHEAARVTERPARLHDASGKDG